MTVAHLVDIALALLCGYFCGLGYGYRSANRDYKAAIDKACETMERGAQCIEKLRGRLRARRILEMRTELNSLRDASGQRRMPVRNDDLKNALASTVPDELK